jgi:hypothetical protein
MWQIYWPFDGDSSKVTAYLVGSKQRFMSGKGRSGWVYLIRRASLELPVYRLLCSQDVGVARWGLSTCNCMEVSVVSRFIRFIYVDYTSIYETTLLFLCDDHARIRETALLVSYM